MKGIIMNENKKMLIASILSAFAISSAVMIVAGHFQYKKARRIRYEHEIAGMQAISDDLREGKYSKLPIEFVQKMESHVKPLRDMGLIK
jgi:hypothetical protein